MLCVCPAKWTAVWKRVKEKDGDFREFIGLGFVMQTKFALHFPSVEPPDQLLLTLTDTFSKLK